MPRLPLNSSDIPRDASSIPPNTSNFGTEEGSGTRESSNTRGQKRSIWRRISKFRRKWLSLKAFLSTKPIMWKGIRRWEMIRIRLIPLHLFLIFLIPLLFLLLSKSSFMESTTFPLHDKILHFCAFFLMTSLFFWIWEVDEDWRRKTWVWRRSNLIISAIVCYGAGVGSEFLQGLLPYKTFQWGDILANLLGTSFSLLLCHTLHTSHLQTIELSRLYTPLALAPSPSSSSPPDSPSQQYGPGGGGGGGSGRDQMFGSGTGGAGDREIELENPWESEEEIFGIGAEDEDDDDDERELELGKKKGKKESER